MSAPRIWTAPKFAQSDIAEIDELCRLCGLVLDESMQRFVLERSLGTGPRGGWAASEVGVCCPRQNGKTEILIARALYGLYVLRESSIVYTSQHSRTSWQLHRRIASRIQDSPHLSAEVKGITFGNGKEAIELKSGSRMEFLSRSNMAGRGFTVDCLMLDEAMDIDEETMSALIPTLLTRSGMQIWYTGSAVDQELMPNGVIFARVRERGIAGADRLAWFEWSLDFENPELVPELALHDPENWRAANPAYGNRIPEENFRTVLESQSARLSAVELLGVGDWPRTDGLVDAPIDPRMWDACGTDQASVIDGDRWIAIDSDPQRMRTSVACAGYRSDGEFHVEVVRQFKGTDGVVEFVTGLVGGDDVAGVALDATGPAGSLIPEFEERGIAVETVSATEHARACGLLFDAVEQQSLHHLGTDNLKNAIRGAVKRPLGDAWAWSRKNSSVDISPLVAVTLALWGASTIPPALSPDLYAQVF